MLQPLDLEDKTLEATEALAIKILDVLLHTPINGVGINFRFVEDQPTVDDNRLFSFADASKISNANYGTSLGNVKRTLKKDAGTMNFGVSQLGDQGIQYDINWHSPATSSRAAIDALRQNVVKQKNEAHSFLETVYAKHID